MSDPSNPTGAHAVGGERLSVEHGYTDSSYTDSTYTESTYTDAGRPDVEGRSVGDLIGEVTSDLSKLMRQEMELAKAEMKVEASKAGKAGGMLAGAGVAGNLMLVFLSVALMWLLDEIMPLGWAAFIVALLWGIVAAVLGLRGKRELKTINPKPERTVESLKEDVQWAKTQSS